MIFDINTEIEDYNKSPIEYFKKLADEISSGNTSRLKFLNDNKIHFDTNKECLDSLLSLTQELIEQKAPKARMTCISLFGLTNSEDRLDWLKTKPNSTYSRFAFAKGISIQNLFKSVEDKYYLIKTFSTHYDMGVKSYRSLIELLDDSYLCDAIYKKLCKHPKSEKLFFSQIDRYKRLKDEFDKLSTEEERTQFITNLAPEEETIEEYNEINSIKKSLLTQIKTPENRKTIISSMSSLTKPPYDEYLQIIKKIILDYFSANGELSKEKMEKIDITLNTLHVTQNDLSTHILSVGEGNGKAGNVSGEFSYVSRQISLDSSLDVSSSLYTLLHEVRSCIILF